MSEIVDLVGDRVRSLELFKSVMTEEALEDEVVEPVGERGPIVDEGDNPPSDVRDARLDDPFVPAVAPAANIGLRRGETARELNGEDEDDGDPLRKPPFLFVMLLIVFAIVCLAACLALSVETKLLTRSLRLPFTSGAAKRSSDFATSGFLSTLSKFSEFPFVLDGKVADFEVMNDGEDSPDIEEGVTALAAVMFSGCKRFPFVRGTVAVFAVC